MLVLTARTALPNTTKPRFIHPPSYLSHPSRRVHQPAALSQFFDDLAAHSDQSPQQQDSDLYQDQSDRLSRRSSASEYGSTRQSTIKLPTALITGVQEIIQSVSHRSTIRTNALGLYGKYRLTGSKQSLNMNNNDLMDTFFSERTTKDGQKFVKPKLRTTYDHLTSISFAAGAMPSAYGATLKVLLELKRRLNADKIRRGLQSEWSPKSLVDYGSGTGSALWATLEVWPDSLKEYTGLDKSSSMIWLNETLLKKRSNPPLLGPERSDLKATFRRITISPTQAERVKHTTTLTTNWLNAIQNEEADQSTPQIELEPSKYDWTGDSDGLLAIMSFTLSDLPNQAARREAIEGMWNSGAETMVVIDRGTPAGFQVVADARQQLLMLGRKEFRRSNYEREVASGSENSQDVFPHDPTQLGSWVLAPCPHDKPCPLHLSDNPKHFCHFSQRIERPKFLKDTKHTTKTEEDAKFSYVIIRRGQRPPPPSTSNDLVSSTGSTDGDCQSSSSGASLEWPRVILPPHKCKGHVIFDVCAVSGQIERLTVPRSQGKEAYYDARKTFWGDSWPHGSKKPALVKKLQGHNGNRGDRRRKKKELNAEIDQ